MKERLDLAILEICRLQAGIITAGQAIEAGMTARQIQYRVTTGQWIRVRRGVYRHAAFDDCERSRLFALTAAGAGHVSHRYAARLHGLDPLLKAYPEVTTRRGLGLRFDGIRVHESKQLHTADIEFIDGLPVSGVERTIMDCCAVVRESWKIHALIDSARAKNLTTPQKLRSCLATHARQGRDGTVRFRGVLESVSDRDRTAIGPISQKAAQALVAAGLPRPLHEVGIFDLAGRFIAQVDSFWPCGYAQQYDGFTYHRARRSASKRDMEQRERLRSLGLVLDEFSSEHVFFETAYLIRVSQANYSKAQKQAGTAPKLWATD